MQHRRPTPAETYEDFFVPAIFGPLGDVLVDCADPQTAERVLDVACGTGAVARRVARIVGPEGRVLAVDANPGMLAVARMVPSSEEEAPIEWLEADAAGPEIPRDAFHLVLCQQGLQFFDDRVGALRRFRSAMVDGGRVVIAVWQGLESHPLWRDLTEFQARHLAPLGVPFEALTQPFSMGDERELRALLEEAGFSRIEFSSHTVDARFPFEGWLERSETAYAAVIPEFVEDPAAFETYLAALSADAGPLLERFRDGQTLRFDMHTHIAVARG